MKKSFIFLTIGLVFLILNTLLEPTLKKYGDTGQTLLSMVWIPGVLFVLYGTGRIFIGIITWLIKVDLRNRYNLISYISGIFKLIKNPWRRHHEEENRKEKNKSNGKHKKVIWGIAIIWFVGSIIRFMYSR